MMPFTSVIKKKAYFTLVLGCLILFDTLIVGCLFLGVWILERMATLLGIGSWGFFALISQISEIGLIVLYLVFVVMSIIISVGYLRDELSSTIKEG